MSDGRKNTGTGSSTRRAQGRNNAPPTGASASSSTRTAQVVAPEGEDEKAEHVRYVLELRKYVKLHDGVKQNISKPRAEFRKDRENTIVDALKGVLTAVQAQGKTGAKEAVDEGVGQGDVVYAVGRAKSAIARELRAKGAAAAGASNSPRYEDFEAFFQYAWGSPARGSSSLHDFEERLKAIANLQQKIGETCQSIEDEIANISNAQKGHAYANERLNFQQEQVKRNKDFAALETATERLAGVKDKLREVEKNETAVRDVRKKLVVALLEPKNLLLREKENDDKRKPEREHGSLKKVIQFAESLKSSSKFKE